MKKILFIVCVIAFQSVFSQEFTAKVLDKKTKKPIPFAEMFFLELSIKIIANEKGIFKIQELPKNLQIQISAKGYKTLYDIFQTPKNTVFYLEKGHFNLEEVVISSPLSRLQNQNILNIVDKKIQNLKYDSSINLSEAISNIAGVSQITTGGIGKPVIRGVSGSRVVTYAGGIRIENQQWGDEHGLGVGGVGISAVELIKGPASLAYGADALGGVLYFVDEKYAIENTMDIFLKSHFFSNNLGTKNQIGLKINKNKLKFNVFGDYDSFADYQIPDGKRVFNTRFNQKNIKIATGFHKKNWISDVKYSFLQNNFGIVHNKEEAFEKNTTHRHLVAPYQKINHHNLAFKNALFFDNSKLDIILGYGHNRRKEFEGAHEHHEDEEHKEEAHEAEKHEEHGHEHEKQADLDLQLQTFSSNIKWYSPTYKTSFFNTKFTFGTQSMLKKNKNYGKTLLIPDAQTMDLGAFGVAIFNFSKFEFQTGIRADYRKIDTQKTANETKPFLPFKKWYQGFTYSTGALYRFQNIKIRFNVSTGFRVPNTSELLSDGEHHGTNRYLIGQRNLKNEYATQIDFLVNYQNEHLELYANPFYNTIKDYIFLAPQGEKKEALPVFEYKQKNAILYGGEAGFHYHPHKIHGLHLQSNFSATFAEDTQKNALPLIPQMKINSEIAFAVAFSKKKSIKIKNIFLQHMYNFSQNRVGTFETTSPAYHLLNAGFRFEIFTKYAPIILEMGVKNILNTHFIDHLSRFKNFNIQNQGINYHLGIKIPLHKRI